MVFSSLIFIFAYFAAVLAVYYVLPRGAKNYWLFAVSLFFYGYGEPLYLFLMLASIGVNYVMGLLIDRFSDKKQISKFLLITTVAINLASLGYFKYAAFGVNIYNSLPFLKDAAIPSIVLPIGISFYTFQILSYIVDVYLKKCRAQKDFVAFGTYVCLFPQLIAGPIVRYTDIEYELKHRKESMELFEKGSVLFVVGLCKKVLLANPLGLIWSEIKGVEEGLIINLIGIIAFSLQIYFDFSGYSDMARGLGNMFGFNFMENFNYPYISKSVTEFWRRWHISLGSWFREYVYIPLGGNRCSVPKNILNLVITWFLTGLWHGASWNFVIWGMYFGLLLILEKFVLNKLLKKLPNWFNHIYALFFIVFGWAIFDFTDMHEMGAFFKNIFSLSGGILNGNQLSYVITVLPTLTVAVAASLPIGKKLYSKLDGYKAKPVIDALLTLAALVLCTASLVNSSYNPLLYFRF